MTVSQTLVLYVCDHRSELCDPKPSLLDYLKDEHICGRPLGLRFDKKTGDLYIADAYFGIMKVGPEGGLATSLTNEVDGVPLRFTNDLDIDEEGNVYFTDTSSVFQRRYCMFLKVFIFTLLLDGLLGVLVMFCFFTYLLEAHQFKILTAANT